MVDKDLQGTDVGELQGMMQAQVQPSKRFSTQSLGNQVRITDTETLRTVVVPLFSAREVIKALEALFG